MILRTIARSMFPVLLLFSVFLLLRGHNLPGGGFVGGLVAAAALILQLVANDTATARRILRIDPLLLLPIGLGLALGSGLLSVGLGLPFMTSRFVQIGGMEVGLPTLFDSGVYVVVLGVVLLIVFSLAEE